MSRTKCYNGSLKRRAPRPPKSTLGALDYDWINAICRYADEKHDGHFTIMKFTTNWRAQFGHQPSSWWDVQRMPCSETLEQTIAVATEAGERELAETKQKESRQRRSLFTAIKQRLDLRVATKTTYDEPSAEKANRKLLKRINALTKILRAAKGSRGRNGARRMPTPPAALPFRKGRMPRDVPSAPGVYFLYDETDTIYYVGQSIDLRSRLLGHDKRVPRGKFSYIELPQEELTYAECYYIWLLRPRLNSATPTSRPPNGK